MLSLSNKLSLTTQPIYKFVNKYSIDFDGVDDRIITDGADTVAQPTTYSFWCKSSEGGTNNGVFGHGSDRIGAFHFNRNADRPQLFLGSNYLVIWNDTSAQDDGEWHHWVVYADTNNVTNSKLYVDGVLQTVSYVDDSGSLNAYTESLTIGSERQVGGNSFEGKIDEFAVYDRELTQAEITKIYNDGSPINLNLNAGDYQSANPLITSTKSMEFDGTDDYLSIGSDCPTGNFTVTSWVKKTGTGGWYAIFSAGTEIWFGLNDNGRILAHVGGPSFSTTGAVDINKWHNCTLTWNGTASFIYVDGVQVATSTGTNNPSATPYDIGKLSTSGANYFDGLITEVGLYDRALTALEVASLYNQGVPTNLLVSRGDYVATNLVGYWKMGDGTNDEYPVIYDQTNPTLGNELVVCGDFACANPDSAWSRGTGWTISDGVAKYDGSGGGNLDQTMDITNGYNYKVTFTILNSTQGILGVYLSGGFGGNFGNGTHTILIIGGSASSYDLRFVPISSFIGELDNVSVKEISGNPAAMTNMVEGNITNQYPLTKIRNYYRMGDGILDGYPIIQDQTSPNLAHIPTTNLITYSEDITLSNGYSVNNATISSNQGISPIGDNNATKLTATTNDPFLSNVVNTTNKTFTLSVYAKGVGSSIGKDIQFILVRDSYLESKISDSFVLTDDWVRYEATLTLTGTPSSFVIFRLDAPSVAVAGDEVLVWGCQIEEQNQATAYIKSDGIAAVRKSSTTNLIPYSEDFSQWALVNGTILSNTTTSPSGEINADKFTFISGYAQLRYTLTVASSTQYSASFYVKNLDSTNVEYRVYDVTNGTDILSSSYYSQISNTEWTRVSFKFNTSATTSSIYFYPIAGSYSGSLYIWGAQVEEQTQAETYVKTTGLPVTIDLFTENNYGTMTNMSASDIVEDTP